MMKCLVLVRHVDAAVTAHSNQASPSDGVSFGETMLRVVFPEPSYCLTATYALTRDRAAFSLPQASYPSYPVCKAGGCSLLAGSFSANVALGKSLVGAQEMGSDRRRKGPGLAASNPNFLPPPPDSRHCTEFVAGQGEGAKAGAPSAPTLAGGDGRQRAAEGGFTEPLSELPPVWPQGRGEGAAGSHMVENVPIVCALHSPSSLLWEYQSLPPGSHATALSLMPVPRG